jgi:arylsulfatase A-like enzyme
MEKSSRRAFLKGAGGLAAASLLSARGVATPPAPNIVVVLADDMGFSDIGCYGGEIPTPNLDRLARRGVRFTQFYNTARCCPTRASLLTGLHPHQAGIGAMAEDPGTNNRMDWGVEGYSGHLNRNCVTIPEVLREAGYHTYMTGKWHVGLRSKESWPLQRGFDRFYGILAGACSYHRPAAPRGLSLGNDPVEPEGDYYTTDAFASYAVRFLKEQKDSRPFFLYLAFNAPHWPLHAREEDIQKFVGRYRQGWDKLRNERHKRQLDMGIVKPEWGLSPRDPGARPWDDLSDEQKQQLDYRMAVYAAQVHCMDRNIGRVTNTLESTGKLDNTLILFLSDNGGCAEPYRDLGGGNFADINKADKAGVISYGQAWANASNTPFRRLKVQVHEGGISTPLIAHWPARIRSMAGKLCNEVGYLPDLMATVADVAGAHYPKEYKGSSIQSLVGRSLAPAFEHGRRTPHDWMFWEHMDNCAVRHGKWKALRKLNESDWELYDIERDRCELNNLAAGQTVLVKELGGEWEKWAAVAKVLPKGTRPTA